MRVWHTMWLQRIDAKIAALTRRQTEEERGRRNRPAPPEWIIELGIGERRPRRARARPRPAHPSRARTAPGTTFFEEVRLLLGVALPLPAGQRGGVRLGDRRERAGLPTAPDWAKCAG
ncbi:hypothetical protein GCM10010287_36730 [Streptomyces variabilis]|uniref:Transposase n=1 Tax=Streptomyces variabilis TaxID=67372 RepID=A0ABQ2U0D3_9ACTN|nr:hypothetical protein GCM10010265_66210 [Streptomyces griseoincarnatus]GGT59185.1 hypothetical protein GCM10010287_36730 [Streptomyces variabilis]